MTIAKDFASKAVVAVVAAAMIITMFAPAAQAQSADDLQKMIDQLMAQVAALKAGSTTGGAMASAACPFTWTRDLSTGATGADVMKLQQFLNSDPDTRVAATGVGSAGMETQTFGPMTAAAVSKFQVKYRSEVLVGLVNPTGYFGPASRAKANSLCSSATPTPTPGGEDEGDDEDTDTELQGEGTLDSFEIDDASDTDVQEGEEEAEIAQITMEAEDGDIEVDRMDFTITGVSAPTESDAYDVFDTIALWVDGEMIAEFDAADQDEYLDEDDGEFRFTNLGLVLREGEEVEVSVTANIAGSVDDAGSDAAWEIQVDEMRYFDADGVAEDDDSTGDMGTAVGFEIVEEGDGEELKFSLSSNNPDSMDIVVDEDDTTDDVTIMEYTIEAEEGDIELNELWVQLETGTEDVGDVVDDVRLVIDGEEFDSEATTTTSTIVNYMFDIDGDVTIDADSEVTVEVVVDLKSTDDGSNYANSGETILARVNSYLVELTDAEGATDIDEFSGTATGDEHTLVSEGIVIPVSSVETTTDTSGDNDTLGEFTIEFDVTAVEGDFYIAETATKASTSTTGVAFTVDGGTATSSGTLTSTADEDTDGVFTVREGETETFTLRVTVDAAASGDFRVTLTEVNFSANTDGVSSPQGYVPTPAQDFRTDYETIQGS